MYDPNANFTICNLNEKLDEYTFGITSLLLGERRASTATCVTALTQLSSLSSASLRKLQNKYPDFIIELQTEARKERDQVVFVCHAFVVCCIFIFLFYSHIVFVSF